MKYVAAVLVALTFVAPLSIVCGQTSVAYSKGAAQGFVCSRGDCVPDEKTAVRIAEAVLPIYGEEHIKSERPFKARLQGERWIVQEHCRSQNTQVTWWSAEQQSLR